MRTKKVQLTIGEDNLVKVIAGKYKVAEQKVIQMIWTYGMQTATSMIREKIVVEPKDLEAGD